MDPCFPLNRLEKNRINSGQRWDGFLLYVCCNFGEPLGKQVGRGSCDFGQAYKKISGRHVIKHKSIFLSRLATFFF